MFNILIKNGTVFDGSGAGPIEVDIGIKGDRIVSVGNKNEEKAKRVINADRLCVSPGFVDVHAHSDLAILENPRHEPKIMQGVTSEINGNCGFGAAPIIGQYRDEIINYTANMIGGEDVVWTWNSIKEYLSTLEGKTTVNFGYLIPQAFIRVAVIGFEQRPATTKEIKQMQKLVEQGMSEGAIGFSTGFWYSPNNSANAAEVGEICKVVKEFDGIHASHMRDYLGNIEDSVAEVTEVARISDVRSHVAHYAAVGTNVGKSARLLELIDQAQQEGIDITFDAYPYIAGCTGLRAFLPNWTSEGNADEIKERLVNPQVREKLRSEIGELKGIPWSNIMVVATTSESCKRFEMKRIDEIAKLLGKDVIDTICYVLEEDNLSTIVISFIGSEPDIQRIMCHPAHMFCTDSLLKGSQVHPRAYGTYPRVLGRYVRDLKIMSLEEAIRKMTLLPAERFGLRDRGLIQEGNFADVVIFDAQKVQDTATFEDSKQFPIGIEYVIVNGQIVKENGQHTGILAGKVMTK